MSTPDYLFDDNCDDLDFELEELELELDCSALDEEFETELAKIELELDEEWDDAFGDAFHAQYDDDPSPYAGDYSEM